MGIFRFFRHLIFWPVFFLSIIPFSVAYAVPQSGLTATVYDNWTGQYNAYNNAPPLPPTTPVCLETTYPSLNVNFDSGPVCGIYEIGRAHV